MTTFTMDVTHDELADLISCSARERPVQTGWAQRTPLCKVDISGNGFWQEKAVLVRRAFCVAPWMST